MNNMPTLIRLLQLQSFQFDLIYSIGSDREKIPGKTGDLFITVFCNKAFFAEIIPCKHS